jgi:hypothetical protein
MRRIEDALTRHLRALGRPVPGFCWTRDAEEALREACAREMDRSWLDAWRHALRKTHRGSTRRDGAASVLRWETARALVPPAGRVAQAAVTRRLVREGGLTSGFALESTWRAGIDVHEWHLESAGRGSRDALVEAFDLGLWYIFPLSGGPALLVPRPILRLDGDLLHSADGPAVEWPGGSRFWFWRGVEVPERAVMRPESLTRRDALEEPDLETRRALIERMGAPRFFFGAPARVRHIDRGRTLWEVEVPGDEPVVAVQVRCPSTGHDYTLRVPPDITTCDEALAWTFNLPPNGYLPRVET